MTSVVVLRRGDDKYALLDETAEAGGFWDEIEARRRELGRTKDEFRIAIKPNLMIFMNAEVPVVATDPALVEHLVRRLREAGYTRVSVVESQNTMSNWVKNRSVANVARVAGYRPKDYELVDLTLDKVRHTYRVRGLPNWKHWVGKRWRDADFRIDFAKFKTQLDNYYTLCIKNQFGTLPKTNKYLHYHTRRPYWVCTLYTIANFPVHFGFVDGFTASDGLAGFAVQFNPKNLKLMIASRDIIAIDMAGAELMGFHAWESPLLRYVGKHLGLPQVEYDGDASRLEDWENVPDTMQNIVDVAQAVYGLANVGAAAGIVNVDTKEFPPRFPLMRYYYRFMNWFFGLLAGNRMSKDDRELFNRRMKDCPGKRHK